MIRRFNKLVNSIAVLFEKRKLESKYRNLYNAGYIYKWSMKLCLRKQ